MALFKAMRGTTADLPSEIHDGYVYYTTDDNGWYVDYGARRHKINNYVNMYYGTCQTAGDTAAKVIRIINDNYWELKAGDVVGIRFDETNTASNPTFNINNTGAKPVWYDSSVIANDNLEIAGIADRPMFFFYDGTQYVYIGQSFMKEDTKYTVTDVDGETVLQGSDGTSQPLHALPLGMRQITLTQSMLTSSGDPTFPYYYVETWESCSASHHVEMGIASGTYNGSWRTTSNAGNVKIEFTEALTGTVTFNVYLQQTEIAEGGVPSYYTKPESDSQMGYGAEETTATAQAAHSTGDFFLWQGIPAKAIADIAQGATIAAGTNVEMASVFGELSKILGTADVRGLRYKLVIRNDLNISLDSVKTILASLANVENYIGVTIVKMVFNNTYVAIAVINHSGITYFDAVVFSRTVGTFPPYNLYYANGVWTDILLASGRVTVSSTEITKVVPSNTYKSIRSIDVTKGLWNFQYMANFNSSNATGARIMILSTQKDIYSSTYYGGFFGSPTPTVQTIIRSSFIMDITNPVTIYLTVMQNSGSEMNVSSELIAYRLS